MYYSNDIFVKAGLDKTQAEYEKCDLFVRESLQNKCFTSIGLQPLELALRI